MVTQEKHRRRTGNLQGRLQSTIRWQHAERSTKTLQKPSDRPYIGMVMAGGGAIEGREHDEVDPAFRMRRTTGTGTALEQTRKEINRDLHDGTMGGGYGRCSSGLKTCGRLKSSMGDGHDVRARRALDVNWAHVRSHSLAQEKTNEGRRETQSVLR